MRKARQNWLPRLRVRGFGRLVFLDECGFQTNLVRLYGRALQGERVVGTRPQGHWMNMTMISAIQQDHEPKAMVFEGSCDTTAFCTFLESELLVDLTPGDVLVMDNLPVHKTQAVKDLLEAAEVERLLLPAYSPDLNPIERMFAKVKNAVRSLAPRVLEEIVEALGTALRMVTRKDIQNWIQSACRTKPFQPLL